jgi:hypothetical protein
MLVASLVLPVGTARGQERPFATPRPWTAGPRTVRLESGARLSLDRAIPLSGLSGDLLEIQAAAVVGLAEGIEARIQGVAWQRLAIDARDPSAPRARDLRLDGASTSDAGDFTLATRVRLGARQAPFATAVEVGVRLPNAGNESGLGRDVTDALASFVAGWRSRALRVVGEAGFAILGSPTKSAAQNDQGRVGLLVEAEPSPDRLAIGAEARRTFGDEGPGNELLTELAAGGRVRIAAFWIDASYRWLRLAGRDTSALQLGLAHTF